MSHQSQPPVPSTSKPLRIAFAVIGALGVFTGGLGVLELVDVKVVGVLVLSQAAVAYGLKYYVEGQVTPTSAVEVRITGDGQRVAGEGSQIPTGTPVDVSPSGPSPYTQPFG